MNLQQYKKRDRVIGTLSQDGKYRVVLVKNSNLLQEAQKRHHLNRSSIYFLGRTITCGALMASLLKGEERIIITVSTEGELEYLYAEVLQVGEVRGYVRLAESATPLSITTLPKRGIFKIEKILYQNFKPMMGSVGIQQGDICSEFTYYLNQSEQIPSAVLLEEKFDAEGIITNSIGLMLQAMPGTTDNEINELKQHLLKHGSLSESLEKSDGPKEFLRTILPFDFQLTNTTPLDFFCRCSMEKFKKMLVTFEVEDLLDMQKQNQRELVCQYCNKTYQLTDDDFQEVINEIKEKSAK